jgi:hypothetical protein
MHSETTEVLNMSGKQPDFGRPGSEEPLHDCARDSRARGNNVANRNSGDRTCNPTAVRAHRVPSPRAVHDFFTLSPATDFPGKQISIKGVNR